MEFLKELLGEELYKQVESKLKGNDNVKLANLKSGEYVDKGKFDAMETAKKALDAQIIQRDADLATLRTAAAGNADLQTKYDTLKTNYDNDKTNYESKLKDMSQTTNLKLALNGKVNDVDDFIGIFKNALGTEPLEFDSANNFSGKSKEVYENLSKTKSYLFKTEEQTKLSGVTPADGKKEQDGKSGDSIGERLGKQQSEANKATETNPYFK